MWDTLTIFRNHKAKVYCIHRDMTAFSILKCQSITVQRHMIDCEEEDAERNGFKSVSCSEFAELLEK